MSDSKLQPKSRVLMMPRDTNPSGTIFGGVILSYLDQAGAEEALCHGAGRVMSRTAAVKHAQGRRIDKELESKGVIARARSWRGLAEEHCGRIPPPLGVSRQLAVGGRHSCGGPDGSRLAADHTLHASHLLAADCARTLSGARRL